MGQLVSTSIALATILLFGSSIFSRALAMGLAIAAMMITDSVHPPGGMKDVWKMLWGIGECASVCT